MLPLLGTIASLVLPNAVQRAASHLLPSSVVAFMGGPLSLSVGPILYFLWTPFHTPEPEPDFYGQFNQISVTIITFLGVLVVILVGVVIYLLRATSRHESGSSPPNIGLSGLVIKDDPLHGAKTGEDEEDEDGKGDIGESKKSVRKIWKQEKTAGKELKCGNIKNQKKGKKTRFRGTALSFDREHQNWVQIGTGIRSDSPDSQMSTASSPCISSALTPSWPPSVASSSSWPLPPLSSSSSSQNHLPFPPSPSSPSTRTASVLANSNQSTCTSRSSPSLKKVRFSNVPNRNCHRPLNDYPQASLRARPRRNGSVVRDEILDLP